MFDPYPHLPHRIKNYILNSVIGHGGFAVVYKATNTLYNVDFAIKVMSQVHHSEGNIKSFEAEVNSLSKLDHPNVIRLYDYFKEDHHLFLVLEYCSGGTLEGFISKNEELFVQDKIKICSQIISALKYCYDMSIAHRDIKTSNILFDSNGRVKVADFGLSQLIGHDKHFNSFCGSLRYLAPEICLKISFNPFKSDVWSLGVLFYRLFTYNYPFDGNTCQELKEKIIDGFYPELLSGSIGKVVRKMLTVSPFERISIENLSNMDFFAQKSTNVSPHCPRIPLSQSQYQRKLSKKRNTFCSSAIFNNVNHNIDSHHIRVKCIDIHMSQTFLTSPITP